MSENIGYSETPEYLAYLAHRKQSQDPTASTQAVLGDILDTAKNIINGQRQKDYGDPTTNFADIARLWSAYLNIPLTSKDVCNLMVLLKLCRAKNGQFSKDTFIDIAGYSAIASYIAEKDAQNA